MDVVSPALEDRQEEAEKKLTARFVCLYPP
jgi:hypothetical protein